MADTKSKKEAVSELVGWHYKSEPALQTVLWIRSAKDEDPNEPIRLLEVNAETIATGSVEPFAFAPTSEVPYGTLVALITPAEYEELKTNPKNLPEGWSLEGAEELSRETA